ncbi:MAG: YajQ family cyclic di-GMP-binding protein [Candidatus Dormibacteria bacterium]
MADASFDVVSEYDAQEMVNAVDQAQREIGNRYDFKGTDSTIELKEKEKELDLDADSEYKLTAMIDILQSKLVKRQIDLKVLDPQKVEAAAKGRVRQKIKLRAGLADDLAKDVVKRIKAELPKLQSRIEGDKVRVTGKSRDDLQAAIKLLRDADLPVPLQFTNYR